MSGNIYKKIRKYAELRNLRYKKAKLVYKSGTPKEKEIYRQEMKKVV